jgi:hypothetical protein
LVVKQKGSQEAPQLVGEFSAFGEVELVQVSLQQAMKVRIGTGKRAGKAFRREHQRCLLDHG